MRRVAQSVVLFAILALCLPMLLHAAQSAKGVIDDATITTEVKAVLAKDVRLGTATGIEVNTTKGVVTLAGKVKDRAEKKQAEKLARSVEGVKKVKNSLQVMP